MYFFIVRVTRQHTGSVINILSALPYEDETGKIYSVDELRSTVLEIVDTVKESNMFDGWDVSVCPAKQEDIDSFESFLDICEAPDVPEGI